MSPPLIDSLPSMAGSVSTVRGAFALSWAWTGAPLASTAAVNATVPANARASVKVPVPGLASPVITESGITVWANGSFTPVPGILAARDDSAGYVTFSVASGTFAFQTADAAGLSAGGVHRVAACAQLGASRHEALKLECPAGLRLTLISRAGVFSSSAEAQSFVDLDSRHSMTDGVSTAHVRHRYLVTQAIERLCVGSILGGGRCSIDAATLTDASFPIDVLHDLGPGLTVDAESVQVCAVALCSKAG